MRRTSSPEYFHHVEHLKEQSQSKRTLWISLFITLFFTIVEVVGGILSNSLALLSDSMHMLSDVLALGLSMIAIYFASKKPTSNHTFGFLRLEIIAAFLNGLALIIISIGICYEGIMRMIHPQVVDVKLMLIISTIGLIVNIVLTIVLMRSLKGEDNINVQSALWHFIGDLLNSVGVIVAVAIIYFTGWILIDPILSILISIIIFRGGYKIVRNAWVILMERVPEGYNSDEIIADIKAFDGVIDVHEFHLWAITTEHNSISAHVVVDTLDGVRNYELINKISKMLEEKYKLGHSTLQIEHLQKNNLDDPYFDDIKKEVE
ncbi:cation diffusion facilitator family transporter [Macrococcus armenti]|uniref:Cation diffusion facilitator family transporter n=1 Tax=Macrococcus armenti TaxID=2875764 RepID=A0ABY3ZWE5_9STAP|nr:cation diffusion facilitator family transporter [Macrococcus armenti]UOB20872.1 cation diffusion facilitator family transporter [Macrococcus armenti]